MMFSGNVLSGGCVTCLIEGNLCGSILIHLFHDFFIDVYTDCTRLNLAISPTAELDDVHLSLVTILLFL